MYMYTGQPEFNCSLRNMWVALFGDMIIKNINNFISRGHSLDMSIFHEGLK